MNDKSAPCGASTGQTRQNTRCDSVRIILLYYTLQVQSTYWQATKVISLLIHFRMKSRLIGVLIQEKLLMRAEICPHFERHFYGKISTLFVRRTYNTNCIQLNRLLSINYGVNKKLYVRNCSKWTPNILRSPFKEIPIPEGTYVDNIWANVDQWGDRVAMVCGASGRETTYSELRELSKRIATILLADLRIASGQVVAFVLPNVMEHPPFLLGAMEAGIICTTLNPLFLEDELASQLENSGAVAAVTFPDKLETLRKAVSKLNNQKDIKIIVTPNIDGSAPKELPNNVLSYLDLLANRSDSTKLDSVKPESASPDDIVLIPYSSGTTGLPKGVCLTQKNLISNNVNLKFQNMIKITTTTHQDVVPLVLPIFHVYGLAAVLINSLCNGAKVILLPKFEESTFLKSLKDYQASVLFLVPPLILYITNSPAVTKEHLKFVRTIISGAAPMAETDVLKCMEKTKKNTTFILGYGLTETSTVVCSNKYGTKPPNYDTVGILAPNTSLKVVDLQTGQALSHNEDGEIWVKGPQVMKCYLNNPRATAESIDKDGWFHTGDIGYYDKNGYLYVTDRIKELIKVKGFQVAPSELEAVLRTHPDIIDAGVIGVTNEKFGEIPVAFLQTNSKDTNHLEAQLKKFLSQKLANYKQVGKYVFIDNIPKSASGKILRRELKLIYQNMNAN